MTNLVLDSSALLALMNGEPGADEVARVVEGTSMSTVNVAEVMTKLADSGLDLVDIQASIDGFGVIPHDFTLADAMAAGELRPVTRPLGLSLGDRACLALAQRLDATALTADTAWARIDLPVTIELIR